MRHTIKIPKPSAIRMECYRTLIVSRHSGWMGTKTIKFDIPSGVDIFEFELNEPVKHRDPDVLDGTYHEFTVVYQNSTKTRKEEIEAILLQ